eukprot:GHVR01061658.1.p1 GENE.GHVR01061658.1~~GHVR01061658.1.p1  ORF type:complete len:255 (+),score=44.14 GHVR01061658.1:171-935(+)
MLKELRDEPVGAVRVGPTESYKLLMLYIKVRHSEDIINIRNSRNIGDIGVHVCVLEEVKTEPGARGLAKEFFIQGDPKRVYCGFEHCFGDYAEQIIRNIHEITSHKKFCSSCYDHVVTDLHKQKANDPRSRPYALTYSEDPTHSGGGGYGGRPLWFKLGCCPVEGNVVCDIVEVECDGFSMFGLPPHGKLSNLLAWWKKEGFDKRGSLRASYNHKRGVTYKHDNNPAAYKKPKAPPPSYPPPVIPRGFHWGNNI